MAVVLQPDQFSAEAAAQVAELELRCRKAEAELHAVQAKLASVETRFREAQAIALMGSWHAAKGQRLEWTGGVYSVFGLNPERGPDLEALLQMVHPDDRSKWELAIKSCDESGVPVQMRVRLMRAGQIAWVSIHERAVRGRSGEVVGRLGTCQDISQEVTQQQEMQFIISALNLGVWIFNPVTQELKWDDSMYSVFQIDPKDFSGTYEAWEGSLTKESKALAVQELTLALSGEKDFDTTFQIRTKAGELREIGGKGVVVRNEKGEPLRMYGLNWDRTKEVMLERSLNAERVNAVNSAKMASLGEMAAGVAHEINNPTAIIMGKIACLNRVLGKTPNLPPMMVRDIEVIGETATRIAKIVKGLATFSRSSDHDPFTAVNAASIIEVVLGLCQQRFKSHGISLQIDNLPERRLECRETQISQVLLNLLNNAFDAVQDTPEPWVRLEVTERDQRLVFAVTDSGLGIPEEIAAKIMNPFFTTKVAGKGTGLGLSISRGIVEDHGGTIRLDRSCSNTKFIFEIPLEHRAGAPERKAA